jgi:hypothetical protein
MRSLLLLSALSIAAFAVDDFNERGIAKGTIVRQGEA